jgi:hypothetical protein
MWLGPDAERRRAGQACAEVLDFAACRRLRDRLAGLFLAIPDLTAVDTRDMAAAAGYPSTGKIPPCSTWCRCCRLI